MKKFKVLMLSIFLLIGSLIANDTDKGKNRMLDFDKKEKLEFVSKIHNSLINNDSKEILALFMTKEELSKTFKLLKLNRDIDRDLERGNEKAKKASTNLLDFIKNQVSDFKLSEIVDIETDVKEINGLVGTGTFYIVFKTPTTYLKIGISEVHCIGGRLFWSGQGISYVTSKEPYKKKAIANNKDEESKLMGEFEDIQTIGTEFNKLPYIKHAHQKARVYKSLKVKGDLDLNKLYSKGLYTIIVKGDLTVTGNIVNDDGSVGSSLFVLGETHAMNLIAGGSIIALNKANIKDFTIGFYNDGMLSIEKLHTDVLLSFDHHTEVEDKSNVSIYINSFNDKIDVEDNLNDIGMLAKSFYNDKELSKMVTLEDDDGDKFYDLDYDVLNEIIINKEYAHVQEKIHNFAKEYKLFSK